MTLKRTILVRYVRSAVNADPTMYSIVSNYVKVRMLLNMWRMRR